MISFMSVFASGHEGVAALPASCAAALRVAGTSPDGRHEAGAFACATTSSDPGLHGIRVDRHAVVVGDVRLDGKAALRAALGASAEADDDLGLVLAAYRAWGAAALDRLRGDFSVAVWDLSRRELIAARDGLGVRPLYFSRVRGGIIASNVLNAIRAYPGVGNGLNPAAIASFLHRGWNANLTTTTFSAVERLAPGTALRCGVGSPVVHAWRHWSMPDPAPIELSAESDYTERYRALVREAVVDRVDPRGTLILLSGGMDSTSIAASARAALPGANLSALTWRTTDVEDGTESILAADVARRLSIPHSVVEATATTALHEHLHTPEPLDEPEQALTTSMIAGHAERARAGVVLEGEDGDALFLPPGLATMLRRESVVTLAGRLLRYALRERRQPYLGFWLKRRLGFMPRPVPPNPSSWMTNAARRVLGEASLADGQPTQARPEAARALTGSIWQAVHDRYSRAWSGVPVDYRWPLLDSRVIEFVFSVPAVPWCQRKQLARRAFAGLLPEAVVRRPKAPVPGYVEALVKAWRSSGRDRQTTLHEITAEYVERESLADALVSHDAHEVFAAWRALQLDRWVRRESA